MVKEMTDPNAPWFYGAYEIFTDPQATRRELIYIQETSGVMELRVDRAKLLKNS